MVKHKVSFAGIASALAISKPESRSGGAEMVWKQTVMAIADVLGKDNPKFNRERFLKASGVLA